MARFDDVGLFWEDLTQGRSRGARVLGPMPAIPDTGWLPPNLNDLPNLIDMPWIGLDCETYDPELIDYGPGWARGKGHICGVSLSWPGGKCYLPMRHTVQEHLNLDPGMVLKFLRYHLGGNNPKIGANLMYDIGWLAQEGVQVNGQLLDVQYAEGLLDETQRVALEEIGEKYLFRGKKSEVLEDWIMAYYMPPKKYWRREIYRSPITLVGPYAEDDAEMPQQILVRQWPELVARGLLHLFEMECKLIRILIAMRFGGIQVDLAYAERLKVDFGGRAGKIHEELEHVAGCPVRINASESIAKAFDRHNIPYPYTQGKNGNPGKPSFTADYLKTLDHPIPKLLLRERRLRKLISTFIQGYILDANVNGKVFCSFHPMYGTEGGAKTGRFSSSDPNLQNIPIRTPEGKLMRALFIKDEGHKFYKSGDYSQIEYRMLAHFATGKTESQILSANAVRDRFRNDPKLDYHDMISIIINEMTGFAVELKNGTILPGQMFGEQPLVREQIKTLNFACVYGVGRDHLGEMLGVGENLANSILQTFRQAVPFAKSTMDATAEEVGRSGICTTILNRQTHFDYWEPAAWGTQGIPLLYKDALDEYGPNIRRAKLYAALNYRLQGSAADVMKKGMIDCWEQGIFAATGMPRLTVHDELGFSDPGDTPDDAWKAMIHTMENTIKFDVPLRFDLKAGQNWMECK